MPGCSSLRYLISLVICQRQECRVAACGGGVDALDLFVGERSRITNTRLERDDGAASSGRGLFF